MWGPTGCTDADEGALTSSSVASPEDAGSSMEHPHRPPRSASELLESFDGQPSSVGSLFEAVGEVRADSGPRRRVDLGGHLELDEKVRFQHYRAFLERLRDPCAMDLLSRIKAFLISVLSDSQGGDLENMPAAGGGALGKARSALYVAG